LPRQLWRGSILYPKLAANWRISMSRLKASNSPSSLINTFTFLSLLPPCLFFRPSVPRRLRRFRLAAAQQFDLGAHHAPRRFGVADGVGEFVAQRPLYMV